jgi:formate C-acetyltransferase
MVAETRHDEYISSRFDRFFTIKPTARVNRLREVILSLKATASINRARIETRVMKETAGQPLIIRRAKIFAALTREMPVDIYPDELLVGCYVSRPRCNEITPGLDHSAYERGAFVLGYRADTVSTELSEADRRELDEELTPYWREQGRLSRITHYGHNVLNWDEVLKKGFLGIKQDAEERLARLDPADPDNIKRIRFLEGIVIAMQAAAEIGKRYADRARKLAEQEKDAARKAELLSIAEVCDWVPANPARTFWEALQSFYFAWMMVLREDWSSMGRVDQYFHPYYERDISEGRLTKEEAQELIDCFLIKANQGEGIQQMHTVAVGGFQADGNDATNELSYMCIEGMMHTRLPNWFAVMVHSKTTDDLLIKACQLCAMGTGHPQFLNMDAGVAQMLARGNMGGPMVTLEDARAAANVGCLELVVPGKDSGYLYIANHNLALAMEMVLTNGMPRIDQEKRGAGKFTSRMALLSSKGSLSSIPRYTYRH